MTTTKIPAEFLEAITGSEITDGGIGTADIADSGVTTAKIANNAITAAKLPDNVITATHIPNGLITGTHIAGTTITATQIANNAVGTDQLAGIARGKIIYGDSNGDPQLLAIGSNGTALVSDGTDISWGSAGETNRLPLAGGTMSGNIVMGDNNITGINKLEILDSADNNRLEIYGNASNGFIFDMGGTGSVGTINFNDFNVGIGATPKTWHSGWEALQIGERAAFFSQASTTTGIGENVYYDSGWKAIAAAAGSLYQQDSGNHHFYTMASVSADATSSPSEKFTILNNGKVGIGETDPTAYYADNLVIKVPSEGGITIGASADSHTNYIMFAENAVSSAAGYRGYIGYYHNSTTASGRMVISSQGHLEFRTGTTGEVMRITTAGTIGMPGTGSGNFAGGLLINHDGSTGTLNNAYYNTGFGYEVFDKLTSGDSNTAVGNQAGYDLTTGSNNTLIGRLAGANVADGHSNALGGYEAGTAITDGIHNTAWGYGALQAANANYNTAIGDRAFHAKTGGNSNVAVGSASMYGTATSGDENSAVGANSLEAITTGQGNAALGHYAGYGLTSGSYNVAIGRRSLMGSCTGTFNISLGYESMKGITSGSENVCLGRDAGHDISTGSQNVAVGHESLSKSTSASGNTAVGFQALEKATAAGNIAMGYKAGETITSGLGNVLLGYGSKTYAADSNYSYVIGYNCQGVYTNDDDSQIVIGSSTGSDRIYNEFNSNASWTRVSDERYKEEITANTDCGLAFINDLKPITYKWKAKADIPDSFPDYDKDATTRRTNRKFYGMIAQDVKTALDKHSITDFGGWNEIEHGIQTVSQEMFVHPLIKAVQELTTKLEAAEARIKTLEDA